MYRAAHDEVDLDLHFDGPAAHQQLGLFGISSTAHADLESKCSELLRRLTDRVTDARERRFARHAMVDEDQVEVDRQPWHIADEEIDGGTALQREVAAGEHHRRHLYQHPRRVEIDLVHGFSTSSPSAERDTHDRLLPVGS